MSQRASSTRSRRRFDSIEQSAYLNLWRTYDLLKSFEDRLFGQHDLSAQQYKTPAVAQGGSSDACPHAGTGEPLDLQEHPT